jgi:hypothetical protein
LALKHKVLGLFYALSAFLSLAKCLKLTLSKPQKNFQIFL